MPIIFSMYDAESYEDWTNFTVEVKYAGAYSQDTRPTVDANGMVRLHPFTQSSKVFLNGEAPPESGPPQRICGYRGQITVYRNGVEPYKRINFEVFAERIGNTKKYKVDVLITAAPKRLGTY